MSNKKQSIVTASNCASIIIGDTLTNLSNKLIERNDNDMYLASLVKAFIEVHNTIPEFSYSFVKSLVKKSDIKELTNIDSCISAMKNKACKTINVHCDELKVELTKISKVIANNSSFLELTKSIAIKIKQLLESLSEVCSGRMLENTGLKMIIERHKRQFVKCSKVFSSTLKEYFRNENALPVYTATSSLYEETDKIMKCAIKILD